MMMSCTGNINVYATMMMSCTGNINVYATTMMSCTGNINVHVYATTMMSCTGNINVHVYATMMMSCTGNINVHVYATMMMSFSSKSIHWKDTDHLMLDSYFQSFFEGRGQEKDTKGNLPSKNNIYKKLHFGNKKLQHFGSKNDMLIFFFFTYIFSKICHTLNHTLSYNLYKSPNIQTKTTSCYLFCHVVI